jgi:hypothetical protein
MGEGSRIQRMKRAADDTKDDGRSLALDMSGVAGARVAAFIDMSA